MSTEYEDYRETAKNYDRTRVPIGIEILLGCLASSPRPLQEQIILDGGCGTGNCIQALKGKVGSLHGLEINEAMLAQAREKFRDDPNVKLDLGTLLDLPNEDNAFDGMVCNQVLHHLTADESERQGFPEVRRVLEEAHRVLRHRGVLVINTCSHRQLRDGFWWADLIPAAVDRIAKRFPSLERLASMLEETGFAFEGSIVPLNGILQGEGYLDPKGPLRKSYRDGDSTWSLATDEELEQALERVQAMNDNGTMAGYVEARERLRRDIGQTTSVFASKGR